MTDSQKNNSTAGAPAMPAIGFLTESLTSLYQSNLWIGASDAATRAGYSLICYAGGSLEKSSWDEFEPQRNIIYNCIDTDNLKGIIIAGSLGNFVSEEKFKKFYHRFISIPLVCLGPEIPTVPTVIADNTHGMRELISHLVEEHRCRHIAFVRGPEGNQEAEERLRIFREVLLEHGLEPDPQLILAGDFSRDAGVNAVEYLLSRELAFDALVGANDDTALGALKAFQEHHIRVPDEVLVVGFDDIEECGFSAPPLTTVRQPLNEMGSKAVEVIRNCISGQRIQGTIIVPATLTTRQSCGCFRHHESDPELFRAKGASEQSLLRTRLQEEIEKIIRQLLLHANDAFDQGLIVKLAETFADELTGAQSGNFMPVINQIAWKLAMMGGDVIGLYHVLTVMRQYARVLFDGVFPQAVEGVFQNAAIAIADNATRAQANRRLSSERRSMMLRKAGQAIASSIDLDQLLEVIAAELVKLDIDGCYLSLYDKEALAGGRKRLTMHLAIALHDGKRLSIDREQSTFTAPNLFPEGFLQITDPHSLLIEPLFYHDEQIGTVIFEVRRCRDGLTYEILQQHISSALKGALLMKKVQEQSSALEAANIQLQKLRDAEHAYLEAIKHELELGREIQMSFLPRSIPEIDQWEIVAAFQPAREVSGDFYDIFTLPDDKVVLVICDVSGKDVSAALFMALIRTLIRALAEQALSGAAEPLDAVRLTNRYLIHHHYGHNGRFMYATLFMAVLDPSESTVQYINAGHNPVALIAADGTILQWIDPTGPAVGIIPDAEFGRQTFTIAQNETMFLYTDGVTEARSAEGAFFSKKRLAALLGRPVTSAKELVSTIDKAVKEHSAGIAPFDDITMVALRKKGR
jgi:phosphoserine phosphatase RsbU/P